MARKKSKRRKGSGRGGCPPGQIRRKGYRRKGYTTAEGTRVPPTTVPSACIEDRGAPGKGADVIPITHEGKLGGPGYLKKSAKKRHEILAACVRGWGYESCLGSINALGVFGKREFSDAQKRKIDQDRDWLVKHYGAGSKAANPETVEEEAFVVEGRTPNPKRIRRLRNSLLRF